jgi:hypothetical protein
VRPSTHFPPESLVLTDVWASVSESQDALLASPVMLLQHATSTARSVLSSSQSIRSSAKVALWVAPELADPLGARGRGA